MNTVIAKVASSNDSGAMSPALTQEHSQNVVHIEPNRPEVTKVSASVTVRASPLPTAISSSSELLKLQPRDSVEPKSTFTCSNSQCQVKKDQAWLASSSVESGNFCEINGRQQHSMTPRIVLPCVDVSESSVMTDQRRQCSDGNISNGSLDPGRTVTSVESAKCEDAVQQSVDVPHISDLEDQNHSMELEISNIIKRIRHLHSILATQHARQQLVKFVENQREHCHSVLVTSNETHSTPNTSTAIPKETISMPTGTTAELNNMPTSALIELVQHLQNTKSITKSTAITPTENPAAMESCVNIKSLRNSAGVLSMNLQRIQLDIDSDATASSSGGESEDEDMNCDKIIASVQLDGTTRRNL